jgi:hypothetical protein
VTVARIGVTNDVRVTILAQNVSGNYYLFRDVGINLSSGASILAGSVTAALGRGSLSTTIINGTSYHLNGFGDFNSAVDSNGGNGATGFTSMSFTLTGLTYSGTGSNYLTNNANGDTMAMHIVVFDNAQYTGNAVVTGFGGNGPEVVIPSPAPPAVVLMASGAICSIGGFVFRRRKLSLAV